MLGFETLNDLKISIAKHFLNEVSGSVSVFENKLFVTTTAVDPRYEVLVFPGDLKYLAKWWILSKITQEINFPKKNEEVELVESD